MSYTSQIESLDDWVTCAYDKNHQMMYRNLANHLLKCRAANPKLAAIMGICPYNRAHHVLKDKMNEHFEVCWSYQAVLASEYKEKQDQLLFGKQPEDPAVAAEKLAKLRRIRRNDRMIASQREWSKPDGKRIYLLTNEWLEDDDDNKERLFYDKPPKRDTGEMVAGEAKTETGEMDEIAITEVSYAEAEAGSDINESNLP